MKAAYETPHHWKKEDQMRPITDKGKEQATAARAWFDGEPLRLSLRCVYLQVSTIFFLD